MIDRVIQTVKTLLNTDNHGNVSPKEINFIVNNVVLENFEELLFEVNRLMNRQNRGLISGNLDNTVDKIREKIQYYLTTKDMVYANNVFVLPTDLRYFDGVFYMNKMIELVNNNKEFNLIANVRHTSPTEDYPIGLKEGNLLKVLPTTIIDNVTVSYLRNPLQSKWTFILIDGVEIFNPSATDYVDIDIHPADEANVIMNTLKKFGVNLKEKDIVEYIQREQSQDLNETQAN